MYTIFFNTTKIISYIMIVAGILLIGLGLWQYIPQSVSSETLDGVYMSITAKRVALPISGLVLSIIGFTFSKFIREVEDEVKFLRNEIRSLSQKVEK